MPELTEAQERIREYAIELILSAAQSGIDDDMDEDGELESEQEWRAALDLAQKIVNGMNHDSDALLAFLPPEDGI